MATGIEAAYIDGIDRNRGKREAGKQPQVMRTEHAKRAVAMIEAKFRASKSRDRAAECVT